MAKTTQKSSPKSPAKAATKAAPKSRKSSAPDTSTAALGQLAAALANLKQPTHVLSEPMVGIRNISNYVIGIPSPFQDEPALQLAAPRYEAADPLRALVDPNMVAQISHKWWMQMRRGNLVSRGMIMRDDSVLSAGAVAAPADAPSDIPATHAVNAILDPHAWIMDKEEAELKDAIRALTAEESLRRLLTAVNQRIAHERRELALTDDNADGELEERAVKNLPWRYKVTEELVLDRLEAVFYGRTAI